MLWGQLSQSDSERRAIAPLLSITSYLVIVAVVQSNITAGIRGDRFFSHPGLGRSFALDNLKLSLITTSHLSSLQHNLINGLRHYLIGLTRLIDYNAEGNCSIVGILQITRQRFDFLQGSGFGMNSALNWGIAEAMLQGSIHPTYRQRMTASN